MRNGKNKHNGPPPPRFPLPRDSRGLAEALYKQAQNIGLLFNKFLWAWDDHWTLEKTFNDNKRKINVKSWFLEEVKTIASKFPHDAYNAMLDRQVRIIQSLQEYGYKTAIFGKRAEARILSGLGGAHPMEVGFAFHPLYGFPYLPGTGLKGVARAWAELVVKLTDHIKLVFGSEIKDEHQVKEHQEGEVIFFDAYAVAPPRLEVDILNPHFPDYYRDPERNLPTEWQSPNPVNFLTIGINGGKGEKPVFQFALASRSDDALSLAQEWLEHGLEQIGFGGKTASDYGYFDESRIPYEKLEEIRKAESSKIAIQKEPRIQVPPPTAKQAPEEKQPASASSAEHKAGIAPRPLKPPSKPMLKQGDKIEAEVLANDGRRVTVRLLGKFNQDISFEHPYYPHAVGKKVKVKVINVTAEGKVKKVSPA